jgi:hypothetical protein
LGLVLGQVAPKVGVTFQGISSGKKALLMVDSSNLPVPKNDSNGQGAIPISLDDEEEPHSYSDDGTKMIPTQVKLCFDSSATKALWVDPPFVQWLLATNLDRPPKILA